jgi:thiol-disulfide isomerase/thioredoxin
MSKNKKIIKEKIHKKEKINLQQNKNKKKNKLNKTHYISILAFVILLLFIISLIKTTPESTSNNLNQVPENNIENIITDDIEENLPKLDEVDQEPVKEDKITSDYQINKLSTLEDFKGRPSVILFVGTYCGHCNVLVPEFKEEIWDNYKDTTNVWVQVINDSTFRVEEIIQGLNKNLNYNDITNTTCNYIPSFVVLDKEGDVVLKSCGSQKGLEDIKQNLDDLLNN